MRKVRRFIAYWLRKLTNWLDPVRVVAVPVLSTAEYTIAAPEPSALANAAKAAVWETVKLPKRGAYKKAVARAALKKQFPAVQDYVINQAIETAVCLWHAKRSKQQW